MGLLEDSIRDCQKKPEEGFQKEINRKKYCGWEKEVPCKYQSSNKEETGNKKLYPCNLNKRK